MAISFASLASSSKTQKTKIITSTQSWTVPSGVTELEVILCGGGGGGAGMTGTNGFCGGGAGSVDYKILTVTPGTAYTVTIGAGGTGTASTSGNSGGTSSFGALFVVYGGDPGYNQWAGAWGGSSLGYRLGGCGGAAYYTGSAWIGGPGGVGAYGYGGGGGSGGASNSGGPGNSGAGAGGYQWAMNAYANTGSGGGGVANSSGSGTYYGGNGGSGVCIIKYWS